MNSIEFYLIGNKLYFSVKFLLRVYLLLSVPIKSFLLIVNVLNICSILSKFISQMQYILTRMLYEMVYCHDKFQKEKIYIF